MERRLLTSLTAQQAGGALLLKRARPAESFDVPLHAGALMPPDLSCAAEGSAGKKTKPAKFALASLSASGEEDLRIT